ncbi:MAG: hypothetical protein WAV23_03895 [Minisyncoccia bacterium]
MKKTIIIFGATDLEYVRARAIAVANGLVVAMATAPDQKSEIQKVNPFSAYKATGYEVVEGDAIGATQCIIFECSPVAANGLEVVAQCDHHNPGDAGYGLGPEKSFEASSLGQLITFLGIEPTQQDRVVAAADHCLAAAYAGKCPGVTAQEVLESRIDEIMRRDGFSDRQLAMEAIQKTLQILKNPPATVVLGGEVVADIRELGKVPFTVEAGVMTGTNYLAKGGDERFPDKVNCSGSQEVIQEFLGEPVGSGRDTTYPNGWAVTNGLFNAYGDAKRGFAGAYENPQK